MGGVWEGRAEAEGGKGEGRGSIGALQRCSTSLLWLSQARHRDLPKPLQAKCIEHWTARQEPTCSIAAAVCREWVPVGQSGLLDPPNQVCCLRSEGGQAQRRVLNLTVHVVLAGASTCTVAAARPGMRLILGCTVQADCATPFPLHHSNQGAFWASWVFSRRAQAPACCNCNRPASYLVGVCLWLRLESDTQIEGAVGEEAGCSICPVSIPQSQVHNLFGLEGWWQRGKLHMQLREMFTLAVHWQHMFCKPGAQCYAGKVCANAVL